SIHQRVGEFSLGLNAPVGMPIAELVGEDPIQPRAVRIDHQFAQGLASLLHRRRLGGLSNHGRTGRARQRPGERRGRKSRSSGIHWMLLLARFQAAAWAVPPTRSIFPITKRKISAATTQWAPTK